MQAVALDTSNFALFFLPMQYLNNYFHILNLPDIVISMQYSVLIFCVGEEFCQIQPYLQGTQAGGASVTVKPGTMAILPQQSVPLQTIHALQSKGTGQTNLMTTPVQLQQNLKSVR